MTITRVGSNNAYASGWDTAFGGKKRKAATAANPSNKAVEKGSTKNSAKASTQVATKGQSPTAKAKSPATKGKSATVVASIAAKGTKKKGASPKAATKPAAKSTANKTPAKKKAAKKKA